MANLDLQFEEFMKEPLSTCESPNTNSSSGQEANLNEELPVPRKFWWMKERPQAETTHAEVASNRTSFSEASGDSPQLEGGYAAIPQTIRNVNVAEIPVIASPDISSSMAEFLEKEKLCKELSSSISEVESPGMDLEFPGDDVTDEEIGSIMEQLSQLAGSADDSAADKSVEEILKEAVQLVRETSHSFSGLGDHNELLISPVEERLVVRGATVNPVPASSASKKTDSKHFITEGEGKDGQINVIGAHTTSTSPRKVTNKSGSGKAGDNGEQLRSSRLGSTMGNYRKTDTGLGMQEISDVKFHDLKQVTCSGTHANVGARTGDGRTTVGNVIDTKSAKHLGSYSGSVSKRKDLLKKEKTVTFEDGLSLFPKSPRYISKKQENVLQTSSQKLQKEEGISKGKLVKASKENDDLHVFENVTQQQGIEDGLSVRKEKRDDLFTKVLSVSPPLIQHGDVVGTPEAVFQLIDSEVRSEIVAALQESEKSSSQVSDHSSLSVGKEIGERLVHSDTTGSTMVDLPDVGGTSFPRTSLSLILEESTVSEPLTRVEKLKDACTMTGELPGRQSSDRCVQVTDSSVAERVASLEKQLLQERNMSLQLRTKLESEKQEHRKELDELKCKHEEEMFTLKKDQYILNAKITDLKKQQENRVLDERPGNCHIHDCAAREHRIALLEAELQQQEQLMLGYQRENDKLCQAMKQLKLYATVRRRTEHISWRKSRALTARGHTLTSIRDGAARTNRSVMKPLLVLCVLLAPLRAHEGRITPDVAEDARVSYEGSQLLKVTARTEGQKEALHKLQDMEGVDTWLRLAINSSTVDVLVKPETADKVKEFLDSSGLTFDVVIDNLQAAIATENPTMSPEEMEELEGRKGHRMTWQSYHRLADIHGYLDYLAQTYPQFVTLQTIGTSVEGRPLKVLKISSNRPGSPAIWIDGGIHAREWISPASVTYIINELTENRDTHGEAVKNVDWYILPVLNPDGYEYSHRVDRLWRKNRHVNGKCAGTDLNRNFGYKWGGVGSSQEPCQETFAGSHPFSEPESAAVSSFIQNQAGSLKVYLSFHSYGQYILHPWGYIRAVPRDHADLSRVGRNIATAMYQAGGASYTVGGAAAILYPAAGASDDWAKGAARIKYTYTIELRDRGSFGFILPVQYILPTAREALAAVKTLASEITNEELKTKEQGFATERQHLLSVQQGQEVERLIERLKDKDEAIVQLQIEVQSLRDKNNILEQNAEEMKLSTAALEAEVEKHKHVVINAAEPALKIISAAEPALKITTWNQEVHRVQEELTKRELELKKIHREFQMTQKEMATAQAEVTDYKCKVGTLQTKVLELQTLLTKERAQTQALNLKTEEDKRKIQDLNRQVKEMERILKRNHPNSISALILAANSEGGDPSPRFKCLEKRVQQLEQELAKSETDAQTSIREMQDKFQAMKLRYEEHTSDLELQLASAKHQAHMWRQAAEKKAEEQPIQETKPSKRTAAPPMVITVGAPPANALAVREDAHLLATIRGLKQELAAKDKELVKIRRDLDESAKTNRRLQKERERQLGVGVAPPRPPAVKGMEKCLELLGAAKICRSQVERRWTLRSSSRRTAE